MAPTANRHHPEQKKLRDKDLLMAISDVVNDGIHFHLPMEDYLAHPGIGSSQLKKILTSPADFRAALSQKGTETKATSLGTAVHMAILEPELFAASYALQPEDWGPRNKGEGYKKWKAFKEENDGKDCISFEDGELLRRVLEACNKHKSLRMITANGKPEVTAVCTYRGQRLKARADWLTADGWIWDVKTTSKEVDDNNLGKTVFFNGYHFQAAHHSLVFREAGVDIKGFGWIFISTQTPAVHVITRRASEEVLDAGVYDHTFAFETLKRCQLSGQWQGFDDDIKDLRFPEFIDRNYDELHTSQAFASSRANYVAI